MPSKPSSLIPPDGYELLLSDLRERIKSAQVKAALAVNRELILLYWQIGTDILAKQAEQGWGSKVIDRLSVDLKRTFPEMKGFSSRNLKYMRALAEAYPDLEIVLQVIAQIPWGHNQSPLNKLDSNDERLWYTQQTVKNGWSRNILNIQIDTGLHSRQGAAVTNFERTSPKPQSDLARQMLKAPYSFDFLTISEGAVERELEQALMTHIREFLLELGVGFSFVGS